MPRPRDLKEIYQRLYRRFGPQHWWPGRTKFEIIVGAVLTQNTNWGNVEKAIANLRAGRVLNFQGIHELSTAKLAKMIRPSGYFNVKAERLKNLINFMMKEYGGSLAKMQRESLETLRPKLLSVNGIGPETADSILLYALEKPVFVIDAYTRRIFYRHNLSAHDADYHELQKVFMEGLSHDVKSFNEYHALIVRLGKDFCRPRASCEQCPLNDFRYSLKNKCASCHRGLLSHGSKCVVCERRQ